MSDAIAVLNAGSSSIKFSLFTGADLDLMLRGQAEAIHTAPRFVAKDPAGATLSSRSWDDGRPLGHTARSSTSSNSCVRSSAIRASPASGTASFTAGSTTPSRYASTAQC